MKQAIDFIGAATWDVYLKAPMMPHENSRAEVQVVAGSPGGPAITAGVIYHRLGGHGYLWPIMGRDDECSKIEQYYLQSSLMWSTIEVEASTNSSFIVVTPAGNRTIFTSRSASTQVSYDDVIQKIESNRPLGQAVHLDCVNLDLAVDLARYYHKHGKLVSIDLFGEPSDEAMNLALLADVIVADEEFVTALGSLEQMAISMFSKNARVFIVTLGAKGSLVIEKGYLAYRIPAFEVSEVVDSTGAGDTFHRAFLYAHWFAGRSVAKAVQWASAMVVPVLKNFGTWHSLKDISLAAQLYEPLQASD